VSGYDADLERWMPRLIASWRQARRAPTGPADRLTPPELKEVGAAVKRLSHGLTRERELVGARYMDDPKLLGAYLLFYWPVSYAQAREALAELPTGCRRALDLGSGPGPVALATLDAEATEVTAADRSRPALELARKLAVGAGKALATRPWDPQAGKPLPEGIFDLITLGHVLNELFGAGEHALARRAALVEEALGRLAPHGTLLIIEPALKETSRALLELRDLLVSRGYAVRAPCLFRGACPALIKESDWCHAEREWRMPKVVQELARVAGLHKEALKMSYLALAPRGEGWAQPPPGRLFRIVSEPLASKGRQRFMGCGPEGRLGLALQDRHRTERTAPFFGLRRGDVVRVEGTEPRGDGLALGPESSVRVVAPVGRRLARGRPPEHAAALPEDDES
jgi:SAM-dependent methyltransferase